MTDKPIKATLDSSDDSVKTQKPILIQLDDIPTPTDADAGKVLGVDEDGKYELVQGGGGYDPDAENKPIAFITAEEFATMLGGTKVTLSVTNYVDTKFLPYMTLGVDLSMGIILYAGVYVPKSLGVENDHTIVFSNTFYNALASKAYCITATLANAEDRTFAFTATEL